MNARLLVEEKTGVIVVPNAAIQRNSQATYVWLVKPDQRVTVRHGDGGRLPRAIRRKSRAGSTPGDVVVTVGVDRLQEGSKVNAQVPGEAPIGGGDQARRRKIGRKVRRDGGRESQ